MKTFHPDRYSAISTSIGNLPPGYPALEYPILFFPAWEKKVNHLLTEEALTEMERGGIPDLRQACFDLYRTLLKTTGAYSAAQLIPVLKQLEAFDSSEAKQFIQNPATRHILVNNPLLKVVLIHWKPGTFSRIHGHPAGGCGFKVLRGRLREKRYATDGSQRPLSVSTLQSGAITYIDDDMAYHAVGNPYKFPAISLHAYTPGRR